MEASAPGRTVSLTIPAKPDYVVLARLALSAVCRLAPLELEAAADLKLAITEAASFLMGGDRRSVAREDHEGFITRICSSLEWHCVDASIWTFRTSNVVFLLLIRPDHDAEIRAAAQSVSRFDPKFIRVEIHRSP